MYIFFKKKLYLFVFEHQTLQSYIKTRISYISNLKKLYYYKFLHIERKTIYMEWKTAYITLKTRATKEKLEIISIDESSKNIELNIHTTKAPIDNMANIDMLNIISTHFKIPKSKLLITKGHKSHIKHVTCLK